MNTQALSPSATEFGVAVPFRPLAATLDCLFFSVVENVAALLLIGEICILFAGIVARYVFHAPLIWSDELAQLMFIWLAMLGAVIALRRGEHMRMSTFANRARPAFRALLETVAMVAAMVFLAFILPPAYEYTVDEHFMTMPGLDLPSSWRAAALPMGMALMVVAGVLRLAVVAEWKVVLVAALVVGAIATGLVLARPLFSTLGNLNLPIFFVLMIAVCVFSGVPIAFSFGLATLSYLALTTSTPMSVMVGRMGEGLSHLILLAVPMFVFLGLLIEVTGMARRLIGCLGAMLGHVKGGLSYVLIGAMYLVSGISGSKVADMAAIAPALFPEMRKRGSKPGELVALLSATGAQTETIPPSLVLITVGSVTGVSITALFAGGMLPAVVVGFFLCIVVWRRHRHEDLSTASRSTRAQIARHVLAALPAIVLPFVIRFAVVEGIATATEVSTIGIVYSMIVGLLIYREFDWRRMKPMLLDTVSLSGAILLIIGSATAMAWALTQSGFSTSLAEAAMALPGGKWSFLAASIVGFIILGSVLEGIPAIVLFGPLLFPIAHQVGVNEVHYAMVVILSMGIGLFAPPFGVGYYSACAVSRIDPQEGLRPLVGYIVALFVGVVVIAAVPWFSTAFL
ncbi:MAG: TRAP transporter large permease subunit [Janthinobacterium lividum]